MVGEIVVRQAGKGLFGYFGNFLKVGLYTIFIAFIVLQSIFVMVQEKSIQPGLEELGKRTLAPTKVLNEEAIKIVDSKGFYERSDNIWTGIFDWLKRCLSIFSAVYIIWIFTKVFSKFWMYVAIQNTSMVTLSYILGFITFTVVQMFYIILFIEASFIAAMAPIFAYWNFIKAVPYLIKMVTDTGDAIYGDELNKTFIGGI